MNFIETDKKILSSGDIYTYTYDEIKDINDLYKFLESIENQYGELHEIIVKTNNIKIYNNIIDFKNDNVILKDIMQIRFSLSKRNIVFNLNLKNKVFNINNLEKSLGIKINDTKKIKYYKNQYDNIIKYDGNSNTYYLLNKKTNEWIKDNMLMKELYDSEYIIEEIPYSESIKNL